MPNRLKPSPVEIAQQHIVAKLADAVWQLLDDMGEDGTCVCEQAKAEARIAFEPFRNPDSPLDYSLERAQAIVKILNVNPSEQRGTDA